MPDHDSIRNFFILCDAVDNLSFLKGAFLAKTPL